MTLITYKLRATALCPADDGRDHYDVEVVTDHMIRVEELQAWFDAWANERIFQEDLAKKAEEQFDGLVRILGQHPSPVEVRYGLT